MTNFAFAMISIAIDDASTMSPVVVDDESIITDFYAEEIEGTFTVIINGDVLWPFNIDDLDQRGINWQAPTPEQLVALCLDGEIGIYA
jgi:hypothetical protein